jgi:predicted unusual protein kinase regulating ubiquinone biosynthesis (AarF/ABC1/UbiB family)
MVGRLGPDTRKLLAKLMIALMTARVDDIVRIASLLGTPQDDYDETKLAAAVSDLMAVVADSLLAEVNVGATLIDLSRRSADAGLRPARELALLGKTLLNLETRPSRRVRAKSAPSRATTTVIAATQVRDRNGCFAVSSAAGHTHSSRSR